MIKRILTYCFFWALCVSGISQTSYEIGDIIVNRDGSRGIVFWTNEYGTEGYMLALSDSGTAIYGQNVLVPNLPPRAGTNPYNAFLHALYDTSGYVNTLRIRQQVIAQFGSCLTNFAACRVNSEQGWFIASTNVMALLRATYPLIEPKIISEGETVMEGRYWSSTPYSADRAFFTAHFGEGLTTKNSLLKVRAVRKFVIHPIDTTLTYLWNTGDTTAQIWVKPDIDSLFWVTATNSAGCEATETQQIFVIDLNSTRLLYDTICVGFAYRQNGFDLPADSNLIAGTTIHTITVPHEECDTTTLTLHLTKKDVPQTIIDAEFCEGHSFVLNGVVYDSPGYFVQFLVAENQCDSVIHLHLSMKPMSTTETSVTVCGEYVWNDPFGDPLHFDHSGIFSQTFVSANGCDSIVTKEITINPITFDTLKFNPCDEIIYNGFTFSGDTSFTDTLVNAFGCDSLLFVEMKFRHTTEHTLDLDACDRITHRGITYFYSTSFLETLVNTAGCDSLLTVDLTIRHSSWGSLILDSCAAGETIIYKEVSFNNDTVFIDTLKNAVGCDSLLFVSITLIRPPSDVFFISGCDSVFYRDTFHFISTIRHDVLIQDDIAIDGCMTIRTADITVHNSHFKRDTVFWPWRIDSLEFYSSYLKDDTRFYYNDTILEFRYQTVAGCDSTEMWHIFICHTTRADLTLDSCLQVTYNNKVYFESTIFFDTILNVAGCDSIITVEIIVRDSTHYTLTLDSCSQATYKDSVHLVSTEFVEFYKNLAGCDSVLTVKIIIRQPTDSILILDSCCQVTYNDSIHLVSTTFLDTLVNTAKCDSIVTVKITIKHPTRDTLILDSCTQVTYKTFTFFKDTTFTDTLVNAALCDSLLYVIVKIRDTTHGFLELEQCGQVMHRGVAFFSDTTFTDTLVNVAGCDSLLLVKITVKPVGHDTLPLRGCDIVWYRDIPFFDSVVFEDFIFNSATGCYDILTVDIVILQTTFGELYIDACDYCVYNGFTFINDTVFFDTIPNVADCDSIVTVRITVIKSDFDTIHLPACDSVSFRGTVYFESDVVDTLISVGTCSMLQTAIITIDSSYFVVQNEWGIGSVEIFSMTFYDNTTITLPDQSAAGCDSIVEIRIIVCNPFFDTITLDSCVQVFYKDSVYTESTEIHETIENLDFPGCDTLILVKIIVRQPSGSVVDLKSCHQVSYNLYTFYKDTTFFDTLVCLTTGCDSIITVNIVVVQPTTYTLPLDSCCQVTYNGVLFFNDTTFFDTLVSPTTGCDSIITVNVIVRHPTDSILILDSCYQVTYNDSVHLVSTTFLDTLVGANAVDCDSIITVNIIVRTSGLDTVHPPPGCDSVFYLGKYYFSSAVIDTFINFGECGVFETAFLSVHPSYHLYDTNLRGVDTLTYLGHLYERDTSFVLHHQTVHGCDSIINVNISIRESIHSEIVVYWHRILAVPNRKNLDELRYATYYWFRDDIPLTQSNSDWIEVGPPIPAGRYDVFVHYNDEEILHLYRIFEQPFGVLISPNPLSRSEELSIQSQGKSIKRIEVFDMNGVSQRLPIRIDAPVGTAQAVRLHGAYVSGFKTSGLHILHIYLDDHTVETIKIIVE